MWATRCVGGARVHSWVILMVAVLLIFLYGHVLRKLGRPDIFERPVIDDPAWVGFDGWGGLHLILWALLGFWFPGHELQALGASLLWEGFEDALGRHRLKVGGKRLQLVGATTAEEKEQMTWYGRFTTDSFFNLAGYIAGSALARRFWPAGACRCPRCRPRRAIGNGGGAQ